MLPFPWTSGDRSPRSDYAVLRETRQLLSIVTAIRLCALRASSASEAEDTEHNMWVKNHVYSLTHHDREVVASRTGWLNDNVIAAAQMPMLQYFPNMTGLQPPALQKVFAFQVHSGEFVQIINVGNKHWCVVSTVGCDNGVVEVYDSLYTSIPVKTIRLIASLVCSTASKLDIRMMDVASQSNRSDCGVQAIAYAFDICSGLNPCSVRFDPKKIRQHLMACLAVFTFSTVGRAKECPNKVYQDCRASLYMSHARGKGR